MKWNEDGNKKNIYVLLYTFISSYRCNKQSYLNRIGLFGKLGFCHHNYINNHKLFPFLLLKLREHRCAVVGNPGGEGVSLGFWPNSFEGYMGLSEHLEWSLFHVYGIFLDNFSNLTSPDPPVCVYVRE